MSIYLIRFDGQDRPVEARSMTAAIAAWKRAMEMEWGEDFDGTEEPEACRLVSDEAVIHDAPIVCLCGSTKFKDAFDEANYRETMSGKIVLSIGFFMRATDNRHGESVGATPKQKVALDALHLRKIDLADAVLVLNVGGYIGDSTRREIAYAEGLGRPVRYLEPHATLQEAQGPEDAGMTKTATVAFLEAERQRLAEEVRGLRADMFDLQLAVGGSSCLDAVRGATSAEREAIVRYLRFYAGLLDEPAQGHVIFVADRIANSEHHAGSVTVQLPHYATLQEAQGPDSATPSASADSCDKNGGTDSSPATSG